MTVIAKYDKILKYDKISMPNHYVKMNHQELLYFFIECWVLASFKKMEIEMGD